MTKITPSRFNIEVTEKDIERAKINDSYRCVVAQAVARNVPDATRIEVDTQSIRFTRGDARLIFLTPYAVQGYVIAFDAGEAIEPFTFQLRNPQRVARRRRTEAGAVVNREAGRARRAAQPGQQPPVAQVASKSSKAKRESGTTSDPRAAYAAAAANVTGPKTRTERDPGQRTAPPRVFKSKSRTYGNRLLRINQQT